MSVSGLILVCFAYARIWLPETLTRESERKQEPVFAKLVERDPLGGQEAGHVSVAIIPS